MKKHLLIALGALTLAATTSCKQELGVELTQGALNTEAPVTVCVTSATTSEKLVGVQISQLANIADSVVTDAMGFAKIKLTAGTHKLVVNAKGYAAIYSVVNVTPLNGESATPIFGDLHNDLSLCPLNAKLQGYVVLENESSNPTNAAVAKDATVSIVAIGGNLIPYPIEVKTNAEGFFTMTAPAGGPLDGMVTYVAADGTPYTSTFSTSSLLSNQTLLTNAIRLSPTAPANYTADITAKPKTNTEALRITFPMAIDTEKVKDGLVSVSGTARVEVAYADNNRTLVITPAAPSSETDPTIIAAGKKWTLGLHDFTINIKSVQGGNLTTSGSFEIK